MAEDKLALLDSLNRPNDAVVVLSEQLDFDFSRKPMDEAFTDEELAAINGLQALRDRIIARSGKSNPTVRDFITHSLKSNVREQPLFCGTGKDVADQIEAWFNGRAADGFVIPATNVPGTFEDFGRLVSPELRKRGLLRTAAPGATLRDSLGLPAAATAVPAQ
jgi:alkanesulfonate monooxygenase SsuD/methylene tetrahydromethanopterin reductase-like flavin-dependent oxidoreductase (luciferase family)